MVEDNTTAMFDPDRVSRFTGIVGVHPADLGFRSMRHADGWLSENLTRLPEAVNQRAVELELGKGEHGMDDDAVIARGADAWDKYQG